MSQQMNFQPERIKVSKIGFMICLLFSLIANSQKLVELYPGSIPTKKTEKKETFNSGTFRDVTRPTLEDYLPEKETATGTLLDQCRSIPVIIHEQLL